VTYCIYERQKVLVYQILLRQLNPRLRYYYFRFLNQRTATAILKIYFRFTLTFPSSSAYNSRSTYQILFKSDYWWLSCDVIAIFKMAATASQIYFAVKNVKIYLRTKFRQRSSIRGRYITISGVWKQMATILKFYFRFPFWRFHVICMWFFVGIIQSDYRRRSYDVLSIIKMAATASQIYFRFPLWWRITIKNVEVYLHTKFWQYSSIRGRDITISGFLKQTAAVLKFYFRFALWHFRRRRHVILRRHTKFHQNRTIRGRVMTS